MEILLTNDDGIEAPGLAALEAAARGLGRPRIVAPLCELSGCGHRVTVSQPLQVRALGPDRFAIDGTPADCVRIALHALRHEPTWVLAGVNAGGNLGADVHHSGTVAAIREAVLHGRPGIAISQYRRKGMAIDWERVTRWIEPVLRDLMSRPWQPGTFWNVNLPHLDPEMPMPAIVECPLDPAPLPVRYRQEGDAWHYEGSYHHRARQPGTDVATCFGGAIAISLLRLC